MLDEENTGNTFTASLSLNTKTITYMIKFSDVLKKTSVDT